MPWSMFNRDGQRKYLTRPETDQFVKKAHARTPDVQGFCLILAATGCRISEALSLTRQSIDFQDGRLVIRCLKKRGKRVFRAIPLPSELLRKLRHWLEKGDLSGDRLFPWSRMTGYRRVCEVMSDAGIRGAYATPKGLRHAFGINAIQSGVPLNMVQRWLGHADIKTTAIYTSAMGDEERGIAERMWKRRQASKPRKVETPSWATASADEAAGTPENPGKRERSSQRDHATQPPTLSPFKEISCRLRQFWLNCRMNNHCFSVAYEKSFYPLPAQARIDETAVRNALSLGRHMVSDYPSGKLERFRSDPD